MVSDMKLPLLVVLTVQLLQSAHRLSFIGLDKQRLVFLFRHWRSPTKPLQHTEDTMRFVFQLARLARPRWHGWCKFPRWHVSKLPRWVRIEEIVLQIKADIIFFQILNADTAALTDNWNLFDIETRRNHLANQRTSSILIGPLLQSDHIVFEACIATNRLMVRHGRILCSTRGCQTSRRKVGCHHQTVQAPQEFFTLVSKFVTVGSDARNPSTDINDSWSINDIPKSWTSKCWVVLADWTKDRRSSQAPNFFSVEAARNEGW